MVFINCDNCIKDLHQQCLNPESCLCALDKHGVRPPSLKDGVREGVSNFSSNQASEIDIALKQKAELDEICDNGCGDNSPEYIMKKMVRLMVESSQIVSLIEIDNILFKWCKRFNITEDYSEIANGVLNDHELFPIVKEVCYQKGLNKQEMIFAESQQTEVAYWLMGRYHIKRIELTGDLIFFNDEYYERNAEALIRREARNCFNKSKKTMMNEIVSIIEDSCRLIKWDDIEKSIHVKCLLNGMYDIRSGTFIEKFDPEYIILNQIPHRYDPLSTFKNIERIVSSIIIDEFDRQSFYDSLSNALLPYSGIDFQFGGVGQAGTGKSQLCILTELVMGKNNVGGAGIQDIAKDPTTQKSMAFKMINIDQDMSSESFNEIAVLKKWITQDTFTARGIYEQPTTFRPMSRLMFMANELYEIAKEDDAEAIYERTHVIRIDNKFRGTNDQVTDVMRGVASDEELDGFITYLLQNSTEISNMRKIHHPMNFQTVRDVWNTFGNRVKEFCNKWFVMGVGERCNQDDVWARWVSFAQQKNYKIKDKKKFKPVIEEITGSSPTRTTMDDVSVYAYHGFRLKTDEEIQREEQNKLTDGEREDKVKDILLSVLQGVIHITKK
jgi:phage/plasmid-associated DNA primase